MFGIRTAIQAAREARRDAPREPTIEDARSPFTRLRAAMRDEKRRREEWLASLPVGSLGNTPVVDDEEEAEKCMAPPTTTPNTSA